MPPPEGGLLEVGTSKSVFAYAEAGTDIPEAADLSTPCRHVKNQFTKQVQHVARRKNK